MLYKVLCSVECIKHISVAADTREEAEKEAVRMFEEDKGKLTFARIYRPTCATVIDEYEEEG